MGGGYMQCMDRTSVFISGLMKSPTAASLEKLKQYQGMMEQKKGVQRQAYAVRAKRHILAVRTSVPNFAEASPKESVDKFAEIEADADKILSEAGVVIPKDLSFGQRPEGTPLAQSEGSAKSSEEPAKETSAGATDVPTADAANKSGGVGPKGAVKAAGAKPKAGANSFGALMGSEDESDSEEADAAQVQASAQAEPKDGQQAEAKDGEPKVESKKAIKKRKMKEARKAKKKPKTGAAEDATAKAEDTAKADSAAGNEAATKPAGPDPSA